MRLALAALGLALAAGCYTAPSNVESFQLGEYDAEVREYDLAAGDPVRIRFRSYFPVRYTFVHAESGVELDAGISADYEKVLVPRFGGIHTFRFQPVQRQPALVELFPPAPAPDDVAGGQSTPQLPTE